MELNQFFKSVIDQDECAVVICNLDNDIVYMNKAADERYKKSGGAKLVGDSIKNCHNPKSNEMIDRVVAWFLKDKNNNKIHTFYNKKENKDVYMVALRDDNGNLIGYYEKHEYRNVDDEPFYKI